jgi:hypothetical protein
MSEQPQGTTPERPTVLALYDDREAAQRAADVLAAGGVPLASIHVHEHGAPPRNAAGLTLDEYATGGFFANFSQLLTGLLGARAPAGNATSYDEVVKFEGAALTVDAADADEARSLEAQLRASGATKVARAPG